MKKQNKRITLFWPLYPLYAIEKIQPNLSIAILSKVLEAEGFEVSCVDAGLFVYKKWGYEKVLPQDAGKIIERLVKVVEDTNPDILGIGSWSHLTPFVAEFSKEFKKRNPNVFIILGGYNPTLLPEETLNAVPSVDCLVRGEGEHTLVELVKKLSEGKDWQEVKGISFLRDKKVVHREDRPLIKNLDSLPFVDFENFVYFEVPRNFYIMTSRSCMHACSFCAVHTVMKTYRAYSPDYIINQMKHLYDLYGNSAIAFEDDDFLADNERVEKISKLLIEGKYDFWLAAAGRSDEIKRSTIKLMKKAHFDEVNLGIESAVPETLKFLNKSKDPVAYLKRTEEGVKILMEEGVRFGAFFIVGCPNETKEDMMRTVEYIANISGTASRIEASHLKMSPGSPLWYKYRRGAVAVFRAFNTDFPYNEKYLDLVWMVPDAYLFRNFHYPDYEFPQIIENILSMINSIKR